MSVKRKKSTGKKSPLRPARPCKESVEEARPATCQPAKQSAYGDEKAICRNDACKLRKGGCKGFEGCPGFLK